MCVFYRIFYIIALFFHILIKNLIHYFQHQQQSIEVFLDNFLLCGLCAHIEFRYILLVEEFLMDYDYYSFFINFSNVSNVT